MADCLLLNQLPVLPGGPLVALKAMPGAPEGVRLAPEEVPGTPEGVRALPAHQSLVAELPAPQNAVGIEEHRMVVSRTGLTSARLALVVPRLRKKGRSSRLFGETHRKLCRELVGRLP